MTKPLSEQSTQKQIGFTGYRASQLERRPAPTPPVSGLSFASMQTGNISFNPPNAFTFTQITNFASATFLTNDATNMQKVQNVVGTPYYGVQVPLGKLLRVETFTWFRDSDPVDGTHVTGWLVGGTFGSFNTYPPEANATPKMAMTDPSAGDSWSPGDSFYDSFYGVQVIQSISHLAKSGTGTWIIGMAHSVIGMTTQPQLFQYGIAVTIIGDRPA